MLERPAAQPLPRRPARVVGAVVTVLAAAGAAVLVFPASGTRSGSGDGFGDLLPVLAMLLTVPLMVIGTVLVVAAAAGRVRGVAVAAAVVLGLGAVMTVPVLMFGKPLTTAVSLCEVVATLAAGVVVAQAARR